MKILAGVPFSKHTAKGSDERRGLELLACMLAGRILRIPVEYHESGAGYVWIQRRRGLSWRSRKEAEESILRVVELIPLRLARFYETDVVNWD